MFTVCRHSIPHYSPLCPTASAIAKATASTTARAAASEECRAAVSGGCGTAAPDSKEEEDEDGEATQIFVKTDEGRTSALQVTNIDTIGETVWRACGRTIVDEGGWYVQCQGRIFRISDTAGSCRVEDGDMLS